jgi:hypothetical protein
MGLLLVLFCCWAVVQMRVRTFSGIIPGSASLIPGWVGANSRFELLREFARKGLILPPNGHYPRKIDGIPGSAGKTGNVALIGGTNRGSTSRTTEPAIRVPQCWLTSSTPLPISTMPAICGQPKGSFQRKCAITATTA